MSTKLISVALSIVCCLISTLSHAASSTVEKPAIWVYSDLSDPTDLRSHNHPQNDPDDIVTLAALLLSANRFNIEGIVVASTNRKNLANPIPFTDKMFKVPYERAVPFLNAQLGGYQDSVNFHLSSISSAATADGQPIKFKPNTNYRDLGKLNTVAAAVEQLNQKPMYVLSWGPLTESAILVKHLIDSGNTKALNNLTLVSHWTTSTIAQGSPEKPFHVANCRDDWNACTYLHTQAAERTNVKFIELGSTGQTGIVDGSSGFPKYKQFYHSALGQVFAAAKFYHQKPDQSDGATFWLLTEFGPALNTIKNDGTLSTTEEKSIRDIFKANGNEIVADLLKRSNIAAKAGALPVDEVARNFSYAYIKREKLEIYCPFQGQIMVKNAAGSPVLEKALPPGNHKFQELKITSGLQVSLTCDQTIKSFTTD
ncbi:DUF1593 domain-containing protein [Echinimonas agarilytica]|uniref:DUF1593 domain-containing protein n=1 Tax=Echinimonas agarilytica TaxID=1215918 RepID=A0AA41W737_9GAMM|nr:DUF1593 domain-containing protein [Echinimonas agarilytica]MCM2679876.1 DUF1593 domain-containing protein [Echinimonas agarilytica]